MATTTTYIDSTFSANAIGARTDSAGSAVTDLSAEEARFAAALWTEGAMTSNSFKVSAQDTPNMSVKVGSGTAKADYFCLTGEVSGQGNYIVRLDVTTQNVTIPAADAAQDRVDEIYLVVLDNAYDVSSKSLPRIAHRKGEIGGTAPGPDTTWRASALLATIPIPASLATITSSQITDERETSSGGGGGGGGGESSGASSGIVSQFESTSSLSYANLATTGPICTVTVGSNGVALVSIAADIEWDTSTPAEDQPSGRMSVALSGANNVSASDAWGAFAGFNYEFDNTTNVFLQQTLSGTFVLTGLNSGSTTFTMKYSRWNNGTDGMVFGYRRISVVSF